VDPVPAALTIGNGSGVTSPKAAIQQEPAAKELGRGF
jgi:hypothetical protein